MQRTLRIYLVVVAIVVVLLFVLVALIPTRLQSSSDSKFNQLNQQQQDTDFNQLLCPPCAVCREPPPCPKCRRCEECKSCEVCEICSPCKACEVFEPCPSCKQCEICPTCPTCKQCDTCPVCPKPDPCPACPAAQISKPTELELKTTLDQFVNERPTLHAAYLAQEDYIDPKPAGMNSEESKIREDLLECLATTPTLKLPHFEMILSQDKWWMKESALCHRPSFHIFRRDQVVSKVFYCFGKVVPDVTLFLDTWISYGGSALMFGAGMKASGVSKKRVIGYEISEERAKAAQKLVKEFPVDVIFNSSLIQNTYDGKDIKTLKGNMVDLCNKHKFDAGFVDGFGTQFLVNGEKRKGQEFYALRDVCKVKYFVTFNLHQEHIKNFVEETKKMGYEELISGASKGLGCHPQNKDLRRFIILRQRKK